MISSDILFKYLFSNKIFLTDLINSFFKYLNEDLEIVFTSVKAQEYMLPNKKKLKGFYGDLIATLNNGNIISIEMYKDNFNKRGFNKSFSYLCRLVSNQMNMGDEHYENIKKVIGISFINGNFKRQNEKIVNEYDFSQRITNKVIDEGNLELYLVRLDLVEKRRYNVYKEERFIRWLRMINARSIEELEEIGKGDETMEEAIRFVKRWTEESSKDGFERYVREKCFEAEEKGENKGIQKRNIEIARNLLSLEISVDDIMKVTGLSKKEIEKL